MSNKIKRIPATKERNENDGDCEVSSKMIDLEGDQYSRLWSIQPQKKKKRLKEKVKTVARFDAAIKSKRKDCWNRYLL